MAHNYYIGRDEKLPPLDREMKRSSGVGTVIYFFAALVVAALAFSWMNAADRSLPLVDSFFSTQTQAGTKS